MYLFKGDYKGKDGEATVNLFLIHFKDENDIHFIYSPHLDLTGYGHALEDAQESFGIVFEDFIDYTLEKKTLGKLLSALGWEVKGNLNNPKKVVSPSITSFIADTFQKYSWFRLFY